MTKYLEWPRDVATGQRWAKFIRENGEPEAVKEWPPEMKFWLYPPYSENSP